MATVQHLEKLYQLQRLYQSGDTLEAAVASEKIASLISKTEKLIHQRAFLRDERRRLRIATEKIEERQKALKLMQRTDWIPDVLRVPIEPHKLINVGGLMFEVPVSIMTRDKGSLLAQLCSTEPPILPDSDGGFFSFDRDWWLFRYIVAFLRDGSLPDDKALLAQLYREAGYWHLNELQTAIEEEKLYLRAKPLPPDLNIWWRKQPNWWNAVDEVAKKAAEEAAAKPKKEDWWKDTSYKGKVYLPLSTAVDKVVTKEGERDEKVIPKTTWSTQEKKKVSSNDDDFGLDRRIPRLTWGYDRNDINNTQRSIDNNKSLWASLK